MKSFFDTNVLVYAFSKDARRSAAQQALAAGGIISVQVLNELTRVQRKKQGLDWSSIEAVIDTCRTWFDKIVPLTVETHARAIVLAREHQLDFFDALIIAAAMLENCDELVTEDLQTGRLFGKLRIVNPFD